MSGHSKWSQIKRKKEVADAKRGQEFTRLSSQIKQAARVGPDPAVNPALAEAITHAKRANMPQANIDRLLTQASSVSSKTAVYEAFGPSGVALIIIAATDNSRRTVAEIRTILKQHSANLGQPGSVAWKFESNLLGHYTAKYPQPVSPENKEKLADLLKELNSHPDIEQVYTDT
ncbi:MAG: YebC/PmpR family DNA-binding transcriptional regulator [bacterium]